MEGKVKQPVHEIKFHLEDDGVYVPLFDGRYLCIGEPKDIVGKSHVELCEMIYRSLATAKYLHLEAVCDMLVKH